MIKMIVITGLDGSGKSTIHNELERRFSSQSAILRLPSMDSQKFKDNPILFECCQQINELGKRGDIEKDPSLKIIAMFSSVVLFNDLFNYLIKENIKVIFCERHPLVDTYIYAKAYLDVMHPSNLNEIKAIEIDKEYDLLLYEVGQRLKVEYKHTSSLKSHALLSFLHNWFSEESNLVPDKLFNLFEIKKPDEIFFLDAPAEILFDRIDKRVQMEYHENISQLRKMRTLYKSLLPNFGSKIEVIDANNTSSPQNLIRRFDKRFMNVN